MRNVVKVALILLVAIVVIILLLLATQVGGIAIRSTGTNTNPLSLSLSQPALRGVPTNLRWQAPANTAATPIQILWRSDAEETVIGEGLLASNQARVVFPCTADQASGNIVLQHQATQEIIARLPVTLLAAGAECVLH